MKKNILAWALYDFANSFVLMAFLFYFSQWLVIDQGRPSWWYNTSLIASSLLFILTAPLLSRQIDRTGIKIVGLRFWTALTFFSFLLTALLVMLSDQNDLWATVLYALATYTYLNCFLFFTPMLNDLSRPENRSWISGLGQGANSAGQVAGILVTIPFVNGLNLFGEPGRAQALLPGVVLFGIIALPMLLFYREEKKSSSPSPASTNGGQNFIALGKAVFSHRSLAFLLLAYFLFSDSILTFGNNFPLYLEVVHQVSDTTKSLLTASILILAAIGSIIAGKIADRRGGVKTLKVIIVIWSVLLALMATITNFTLLIPIFLLAGLLYGPMWAISRSLVGQLTPPDLVGSSYSYYVVAERFATFIGPALWSITIFALGENQHAYQGGMWSLAIILVISLWPLCKVQEPIKN